MVHIKKLEVYGFKSFGFKNTQVNFEKGLVAVTGPNGSGKSNILDAIMFAIGETSTKSLRVDKFQSLFHDTQNSTHRLVRVNLTFDNSDRGIPINEDSITLTRQMEGQNGESQYILNGKTVSKTAILELLEVVLADPNKLNIVQQGMITRISELNSEDRRRIIEDIVGLSYFDEKKTEAMKQLDDADRRLEVAFARMGEIRNRIDELEVERNDQLRYEHLNQEINRYKAIEASNKIRSVKERLSVASSTIQSNSERTAVLVKQIEQLRGEIESLESEKAEFMVKVDAASKAKAEVATQISRIVHEDERTRVGLAEIERQIADFQRRITNIQQRKSALEKSITSADSELAKVLTSIDEKKLSLEKLNDQLKNINALLGEISSKLAQQLRIRQAVETRITRLNSLKNTLELAASKSEEKLKTIGYRQLANDNSLNSLLEEIRASKERIATLNSASEEQSSKIEFCLSKIQELVIAKTSLQQELDLAMPLMARANNLATKFEERASVVRKTLNEDIAIAELMKNKEQHEIIGLVHGLLSWDEKYERAVLAVGTEWMKCIVVPNVTSMINLATFAKKKHLPRVKIVPLDLVARSEHQELIMPETDANVIGRLCDLVHSNYERLSEFFFSDVLVVKNSSAAFSLANQGYRTVTVDGEYFEPQAGAMSLDYGGTISNLTKAILFGSSVQNLRAMLVRLGKTIESNNLLLRETQSSLSELEAEKFKLNISIGNTRARLEEELALIEAKENAILRVRTENQQTVFEAGTLVAELDRIKRRLALISPSIQRHAARLERLGSKADIERQSASKNSERTTTLGTIDNLSRELNKALALHSGMQGKIESESSQIKELAGEEERLVREIELQKSRSQDLGIKSQALGPRLQELRDQEQRIIDSSGNAYSVLQQYEQKIKSLSENERRVSKENNVLERDSALLRKEAADLASEEERLTNDLLFMGYKGPLEEMQVGPAIHELGRELEEVRAKINAKADEAYNQVVVGYRGMSSRRNQLETERNSIVSFIEQIGREKKEVFMEAFTNVDSDIRSTFKKMTGGSAWLEIENSEDIFSSGVMLLVQFPNKTLPRESTSLSGGEKTIAAIVFLLALQSLKPSPFYLMDEVDAHLDAQNTERLSKILLERSANSQIIMVTLKDSTVAKASLIYGVYAREGESYVVRYKNPAQVPLAQIIASETKQ